MKTRSVIQPGEGCVRKGEIVDSSQKSVFSTNLSLVATNFAQMRGITIEEVNSRLPPCGVWFAGGRVGLPALKLRKAGVGPKRDGNSFVTGSGVTMQFSPRCKTYRDRRDGTEGSPRSGDSLRKQNSTTPHPLFYPVAPYIRFSYLLCVDKFNS